MTNDFKHTATSAEEPQDRNTEFDQMVEEMELGCHLSTQELWNPHEGFNKIAEALGLRWHPRGIKALNELVYWRGLETVIDEDMVGFLNVYPWKHSFRSAGEIVGEAVRKHAAAGEGQLLAPAAAAAAAAADAAAPEDYAAAFARGLLWRADRMRAEAPREEMRWFPRDARHALALALALMLWMYLEQLTPGAARRGQVLPTYGQALVYLGRCFRCPGCGAPYGNADAPETEPRVCRRCPEMEEGGVLECPWADE